MSHKFGRALVTEGSYLTVVLTLILTENITKMLQILNNIIQENYKVLALIRWGTLATALHTCIVL